MFAAALLVLFRGPVIGRIVLTATPLLVLAGAIGLLITHRSQPVIAHSVGGYVEGLAIPFVSDSFTALMLAVTALSTLAAVLFMIRTREDRYRFVPPLILLLVAGVDGALLTGDLFNLFVWVEVMLMPSYALIAVTGSWRRLGIGRMFVLVNLLTSTILLIGVGMVYGTAGTVNLAELAGAGAKNPVTAAALGIVLLALAVKAGVVPVHGWLPRSYPATSGGVMGLFSALHTKVALYAIFRIIAVTFDGRLPYDVVALVLVIVTMLVGAIATAGVRRIRAALGFQMVSGVGHILIGVVLMGQVALGAGILYMIHHIVTMSALVLAIGAVEHIYGSGKLDHIRGLARREPWVATVLALGFLSLVGLPPTSGLWGKIGLMTASGTDGGVEGYLLIAAIIVASIASMMSLQKVWRMLAWGKPMESYRPDDETMGRGAPVALPVDVRIPVSLLLPSTLMIAVSVAIFVGVGVLLPEVNRAAGSLVDIPTYVKAVLGR
nr:monovalent cation/H+ antiporter subunit D family protein [Devriesea agamarum]